ncbi:MAG TPA: HAD-IIA family hydrolase [Candidatus Limnocylindria bacterium]|nr:HAD-IIA family hydrolase [Candidatus Limnocylindria bacterium]
MSPLPERVRLVVFDLDGVIYRGTEPIAGAPDLVGWLHERGVAVRFATNNSMVERRGYVTRLAAMGIPTVEDEIVTSTSASIEHLRRHVPDVRRILAIGAAGMRTELLEAGYDAVMADEVARDAAKEGIPDGGPLTDRYDAVLVGLDPQVDYARLAVAMSAVEAGARLIATNADTRYPTPAGFLPGAGSIVAALATATGVTPEVIGKPAPAMFTAIFEASGVDAAHAVVVGDNPDADVAGAHRAGCAAILVLTGVASAEAADALEGERRPDAVAAGPAEVRRLLEDRLS